MMLIELSCSINQVMIIQLGGGGGRMTSVSQRKYELNPVNLVKKSYRSRALLKPSSFVLSLWIKSKTNASRPPAFRIIQSVYLKI